MNVITAAILGFCVSFGGAVSVHAETDAPKRDSAASDTSLVSVTDSTQVDASMLLAGNWHAAETTDEEKLRLTAIDEVTKHLSRFKRGKARDRLADLTSPPCSLTIEVTDSTVAITSGDRRFEIELGGSPVEVTGTDGTTQMSAAMEGERLVVQSRDDKGGHTVTFQADGDDLSREVTMTSDKLDGPLTYVTTYARME